MVRLKDIAEKVGVSISTVSRVIKDDKSRNVNQETKQKVWDAVKELGYIPNLHARNLVTNQSSHESKRRTMKIGWVADPKVAEFNPYFSNIYSGISNTLDKLNYTLINMYKDEIADESRLLKMIHESGIEGIILVDRIDEKTLKFLKKYLPVVGLDFYYSEETITVIDYDRKEAAKMAVEHLINQGHEKIGFIGGGSGPRNESLAVEKRFQGYLTAIEEAGMVSKEDWIIDTGWLLENSYEGMKKLLKEQSEIPTAMFCASDLMAIAAMRAVFEKNLKVPDDIAFIGFDNIEMAKYSTPPLTSIDIPKYEIGELAAKTIVDKVEGKLNIPIKIFLPFELIVRESSKI
ncbi:LacI family DNA-binding transcriptional regulator [Lederbergia lenta]|uniref:LacI family transcriptional regulator n=1 Tax=Lederbergia lenta TaxID=1467 RepID=A0A2X4WJN4_LEDLE|nr:LacI family DNA-binding transcriptional regulator [Lederbergia lenta]MCM3112145.1 LacI family transcriptional regulator [Lederbergia lenta]MEC2323316.1 LacI family DNA-binding transcriptional regulator [Lederbergia lenta]SQI63203.1 LacI family transcriptional regulator [Lederbergia lenta]